MFALLCVHFYPQRNADEYAIAIFNRWKNEYNEQWLFEVRLFRVLMSVASRFLLTLFCSGYGKVLGLRRELFCSHRDQQHQIEVSDVRNGACKLQTSSWNITRHVTRFTTSPCHADSLWLFAFCGLLGNVFGEASGDFARCRRGHKVDLWIMRSSAGSEKRFIIE